VVHVARPVVRASLVAAGEDAGAVLRIERASWC
jgi:hypothetical protein